MSQVTWTPCMPGRQEHPRKLALGDSLLPVEERSIHFLVFRTPCCSLYLAQTDSVGDTGTALTYETQHGGRGRPKAGASAFRREH